MSDSNTVTMETRRFVTASVNMLHAAFIKAPRAQAKRHFDAFPPSARRDYVEWLTRKKSVWFHKMISHFEEMGTVGLLFFS